MAMPPATFQAGDVEHSPHSHSSNMTDWEDCVRLEESLNAVGTMWEDGEMDYG